VRLALLAAAACGGSASTPPLSGSTSTRDELVIAADHRVQPANLVADAVGGAYWSEEGGDAATIW
jgi:hypothetical protein